VTGQAVNNQQYRLIERLDGCGNLVLAMDLNTIAPDFRDKVLAVCKAYNLRAVENSKSPAEPSR